MVEEQQLSPLLVYTHLQYFASWVVQSLEALLSCMLDSGCGIEWGGHSDKL